MRSAIEAQRFTIICMENNHSYDVINVNSTLYFTLQPCTPKSCKHVLHDGSALCAQLKLFSKVF